MPTDYTRHYYEIEWWLKSKQSRTIRTKRHVGRVNSRALEGKVDLVRVSGFGTKQFQDRTCNVRFALLRKDCSLHSAEFYNKISGHAAT